MFVALSELCAQCYALVCKSELFRQAHTTHHITSLLPTSKSKNLGSTNLKNRMSPNRIIYSLGINRENSYRFRFRSR